MKYIVSTTALLLCAASSNSFGQSTDTEGVSSGAFLDEIVVTAQKRAENLQETPLAISALSAEAIEQRSISGVGNLSAIAPSLTVTGSPSAPTNASVFIRGIGSGDIVLTADSPVAVYVDGVVLARAAGSAFELADIERIEVLRGPQGTLYGRNTIGGAVNIINRKPSEEFGIRQKVSVGNYDAFQSRTAIDTGELGNSGLRATLSYMRKENDGYVNDPKQPEGRDPGANVTDAARLALAYDTGSIVRAHYAYDYNRNKGYPTAFQLTAVRPDIAAFFAATVERGGRALTVSPERLSEIELDTNGAVIDKIHAHTLTLEVDVGDNATLKSLTGYRKWQQKVRESDQDGNGGLLAPILGQGPDLQPITLFGASAQRRQHQWSQEFNLIGKAGTSLDYVLGAYYFTEKAEESNPQSFSVILPFGALPRETLLEYENKAKTTALFAQATWQAVERLNITGGVRYTWDEKSLVQAAPVMRDVKKTFSNFNWSVAADYEVSDTVMAYARVATGYKSGGFNARSFDRGFDPEDLTSYEVGLKTELFDRRLRFNLTAYLADHTDVQVSSFEAGEDGAVASTQNAGKARYKGIELEMSAVPAAGLNVYATVGYVDRQYKEYVVFDQATGQFIDIADIARFQYSPSTTVNTGAQYEFPEFSFGILTARLDYNYMTRRYFTANPLTSPFGEQISAAPRGLLDARITLSELQFGMGEASIALWGRNITNKKYKMQGIDFGQLGFGGNIYGNPATYGVDFNVKF